MVRFFSQRMGSSSVIRQLLRKHFGGAPVETITTSSREFPLTSRVDLEVALKQWFERYPNAKLVGINLQVNQETTLATLLAEDQFGINLGPLQYDEIDIGDPVPVRCLTSGLWLAKNGKAPFAVMLALSRQHGMTVHLEIAVSADESGSQLSQEFFRDLELGASMGRTYRGRVISLESFHHFSGLGAP